MRPISELNEDHIALLKSLNLLAEETNITEEFTDDPDGELDVSRLAEKKPAFRRLTTAKRWIFKNIIIANTSYTNQTYEQTRTSLHQLPNYYAILANLGCPIYFWNGRDIVSFDARSGDKDVFAAYLRQVENINPSAIAKAAQAQGISTDNSLITNEDFDKLLPEIISKDEELRKNLTGNFKEIDSRTSFIGGRDCIPDLSANLHASSLKIPVQITVKSITKETGDIPLLENAHSLIFFRKSPAQPTWTTYLNLMLRSPQLSYFELNGARLAYSKNRINSGVSLKNLPTIKLVNCGLSTPAFVDILLLSHVKHLILDEVWLKDLDSQSNLYPHGKKFLPHLHFVSLNIPSISLNWVIQPHVKVLEINFHPIPSLPRKAISVESFLRSLSQAQVTGLEHLSIWIATGTCDIPWDHLKNILPDTIKTIEIQGRFYTYEEIAKMKTPEKVRAKTADPAGTPSSSKSLLKRLADEPATESGPIRASAFDSNGRPCVAELKIDSDTKASNIIYQDPILFETNNPENFNDTSLYRLRVYNKISNDADATLGKDSKWEPYKKYDYSENIAAEFKKKSKELKDNLAYSRIAISPSLKVGEQILPSLSPNEELTHIQIDPTDATVEIFYDEKTRLYSVTTDKPVQLSYLLKVNRVEHRDATHFPPELDKIINYFKGFNPGDLKPTEKALSGRELLNHIKKNKTGVCRHQSIACFDTLLLDKKYKDYRFNLISNSSHAFIEVIKPKELGKKSIGITVNLGGAVRAGYEPIPFGSETIKPLLASASKPKEEKKEEEKKRNLCI